MLPHSFTVNGTDIKAYIQKYGLIQAAPRYVEGNEGYVARSGRFRPDIITEKQDLTVRLMALKSTELPTVIAYFTTPTSTVVWWDSKTGATHSGTYLVNLGELVVALQDAYKEVFEGLEITLTEL